MSEAGLPDSARPLPQEGGEGRDERRAAPVPPHPDPLPAGEGAISAHARAWRLTAAALLCGAVLLAGVMGGGRLRAALWREPASRPDRGALLIGAAAEEAWSAVPSPPGGERLFLLDDPRRPGAQLVRYRSDIALSDLVAYYRREMTARGWKELADHSREYTAAYGGEVLVFGRGRLHCLIAASDEEGGRAVTVVLDTGAAGSTRTEETR